MAKTAPFPGNSRAEWAIDSLGLPALGSDGLLRFSYAVYANQGSKNRGKLPFLYVAHQAMVREDHQRIIQLPSGEMLHVSGAEVLPEDMDDFLANDSAAYRWLTKSDIQWEDDRGRTLAPWMFPTYWGVMEGLDPQWLREKHILLLAQQVEELRKGMLKGAEARGLSGDHRNTTLDLQVGANEGDIRHVSSHSMQQSQFIAGDSSGVIESWARFNSVNMAQGVTVDVAHLTLTPIATRSSQVMLTDVFAEDSDDAPVVADDTDWHNRTLTTASAAYDGTKSWTFQVEEDLSGMVSVVQEVVDRGSWVANNDMAFFWNDGGSDSGDFLTAYQYNNSSSLAPKVHIEFTAGENPDARSFIPRAVVY